MALFTLLTDFDIEFACIGSHDDGMFRGCEEHDFTDNQFGWVSYVRLVMQIVENCTCMCN